MFSALARAPSHHLFLALFGTAVFSCAPAISTPEPDLIAQKVDGWLAEMTLEEKVAQMHGTGVLSVDGLYLTATNDRLGIPGFAMSDGPRGLTATTSTTFPVPMARGASFDPDLERAVGEVIGAEAHAYGANVLLSPCVNLLSHPSWGRAQETYGEDPALLARMGVAHVQGAQQHIAASVKHLAVNNIELSRFDVDVTAFPRLLHEVYLPAFRAVVREAQVASVMTAYNSVNGAYCSENAPLLTDILRDLWGFGGFVESDWIWGTHNTVPAVNAGLDVEMPYPQIYGDSLIAAVEAGEVQMEVIDASVRRILTTKASFSMDDPAPRDPSVIESQPHAAVALRAARESLVLMRNEAVPGEQTPVLPFTAAVGRVAVVGALSDAENLGDTGSSASYPSSVVTPLEGIEALAQARGVTVDALATDTLDAAAVSIVGAADVAVVVVGLTADDEGEYIPLFPGGADREILTLSDEQVALIEQVEAVQPHTVVLVEGGSAVVMDPWITQVPAAMMIWYPGQSGGTAIAEALWGDINPSGKMPLSVPTDGAMLPVFDNVSAEVTYTELHGYWHLEAVGAQPRFAFGHGESYTTFALSDVSAPSSVDGDATSLTVTLNVTNTGGVAGAEVVQVYGRADDSAWTRPLHRLVGFARVELAAGATSTVEVVLDLDMLRHWDETAGTLTLEDTTYTLEVGTASDDLPLQTTLTLD